jgi:protein involved in polysaccharide export with SLBB domain
MMKRFSTAIAVAMILAGCFSVPPANLIRRGDSLRVALTGIPEPQTLACTVDREGAIKLPFLGAFPAAGNTPSELEVEIKRAYSELDVGRGFRVEVTRMKEE